MPDLPERLKVTAVLDPRPRYAGTSHEDATARAMGFPGALLPGVFVYGHAMRPAVIGWGADWLARGRATVRFRRPVFAGDPLLIERGPLARGVDGVDASVTVINTVTGQVLLDGTLGLADATLEAPDLAPRAKVSPPVALTRGNVPVGIELGSEPAVLDARTIHESLADFHETETIYMERSLIHSGCLIRQTMGDAMGNLSLPMPLIFAGLSIAHLAPAPIGATYRTAARITRAWEARGKHFFETEEWLLANGRPVARHIRQNLYDMDPS